MKDIITLALSLCGFACAILSFFVRGDEGLQLIQMAALFFIWYEVRVK